MAIAKEIYTPKKIIRQLKEGDFYKELFAEMIQAYKDEDLQKLSCLVSDRRYMSEEAEKAMVINRNHNWVNKIPAMIKDKSVFFAIGAGHLPGKNGILQLLEKGGYIVNPLFN